MAWEVLEGGGGCLLFSAEDESVGGAAGGLAAFQEFGFGVEEVRDYLGFGGLDEIDEGLWLH